MVAEEGASALYGGLPAHLLQVTPDAIVMYSIYEPVVGWGDFK